MNCTQAHPVAEFFPLLDPNSDRYLRLVASIQRNGLLNAIILDNQGRILDGRNRLRACKAAGVEPRFVNFSELDLGPNEDDQPVSESEFAFDQNFARRDLTDSQRTLILASYDEFIDAALRGGQPGNINNNPAAKAEKSITPKAAHSTSDTSAPAKPKRAPAKDEKLAKKAGVSRHKARQAIKVVREASPEVNAAVRAGEMSLKDAVKTVVPAKVAIDAGHHQIIVKLASQARVKVERSMNKYTVNARVHILREIARQLIERTEGK